MKSNYVAATLAGLFVTAAHAQGSVTLYGLLDAGVSYTNNVRTGVGQGSDAVRFSSGLLSAARWGLRGTEDLGGGLKTIFALENGFNLGTGASTQGGREFGRGAYVGLASAKAGTVSFGRQNEFMYSYVGHMSFEDFNGHGGAIFTHVLDNDNMLGTFRFDNAVKYSSIDYNGFSFGGMYGFSNQAGGFANNRAYSLGVKYDKGPLRAALGYTQLNNSGAPTANAAGGAVDSGTTSGDSQFTAQRQRTVGGGAAYAFGPLDVGVVVTNTLLTNAVGFAAASGATVPAASVRFTNYEINAHYYVNSALTLGVAYTYTDGRYSNATRSATPKWDQISLLCDYALSKRTDAYFAGTYQHLSGGFAQGTAGVPTSFQGANTHVGAVASGPNQIVLGVGLRTHF